MIWTSSTAVISQWVGTNSGLDYWNGTLDWTTGLNYFAFLNKFLHLFLEAYICLTFTSIWLLWIIVVITIVGYCSVFINTSKYIHTYLKTQYIAKCLKWKSFTVFGGLIGNHAKLFQQNNTAT